MPPLPRVSMRARLLALALVPLVGVAVLATLWAQERSHRADAARHEARVTAISTGLAAVMLSVDVEERAMAADDRLAGGPRLIAVAAREQAKKEIAHRRRTLAREAGLIDRLAGRRGAWTQVARRIDAVLRIPDEPIGRDPTAGLSLIERVAVGVGNADAFASALAGVMGLDGHPRHRVPQSVAAMRALDRLLDDITATQRGSHDAAALMGHAVRLQAHSNDEMFAALTRVARDDWRGAAADLVRVEEQIRGHIGTLQALIPPAQEPLLADFVRGDQAERWERIIKPVRARAVGDRTVRLPRPAEFGLVVLARMQKTVQFPIKLGDATRRAAVARASEARAAARAGLIAALGLVVATLVAALLLAASIRRPLRRVRERARAITRGDLTPRPPRRRAPPEITDVAVALEEVSASARLLQQQAAALARGDTESPALRAAAPGSIGATMRRSVDELAAVSAQLRASEALSRAIVATAADAIWTIGPDGCIRSANPAAVELLDGREVIGLPVVDVLGETVAGEPVADLANEELQVGGRAVLVSTSSTSATSDVAEPLWTVFARDISVLKAYEEQLTHQAFHDALTGLPNRALLLDRVEHALARRSREGGEGIALLMVDLDDFKGVNDVLGHAAGDELLVGVADRLSRCLRPGDTAARLGGDEFAVLLENVAGAEEAEGIARRIVDALALPLRAGDHDFAIAASVGVRCSDRGVTAHTLLRDADTAMYAAKASGKGRVASFTASMHAEAARRLVLRGDLAAALAEDQLRLLYQPMVDLGSREIVAAEALLRWEHPEHGTVPPLDFIPTAEESGLIIPIGRWVLREACMTAASWPAPIAVSVNVSGVQLLRDDMVAAVRDALGASGLEPHRLVVELTESVLLSDVDAVTAVLAQLKELGVEIAIDDFGTGYCSLAYLKRFPVDHLKIDRAFVLDLVGGDDRSLARSIVDLAGVLGLSAVAEGVETAEQADLLTHLSCDRAQGYHFSRPVPAAELATLLGGVALT